MECESLCTEVTISSLHLHLNERWRRRWSLSLFPGFVQRRTAERRWYVRRRAVERWCTRWRRFVGQGWCWLDVAHDTWCHGRGVYAVWEGSGKVGPTVFVTFPIKRICFWNTNRNIHNQFQTDHARFVEPSSSTGYLLGFTASINKWHYALNEIFGKEKSEIKAFSYWNTCRVEKGLCKSAALQTKLHFST